MMESFCDVNDWEQYFHLRPLPIPQQSGLDMEAYRRCYTDLLHQPLTLYFALKKFQLIPNLREVTVHLVGADEYNEVAYAGIRFRELVQLVPDTKFELLMVGPDIATWRHGKTETFYGGRLRITYLVTFYHVYAFHSTNSVKLPDMVVGFNANCHQTSWPKTFGYICSKRIPACFTSWDVDSHQQSADVAGMNYKAKLLFRGENPFRSLRRQSDPWSPNKTFSSSQYFFDFLGFREGHMFMPS